jgi:hypothetical protein
MPFMKLPKATRAALEREVVPSGARLELKRIIRDKCSFPDGDDDGGIALLRENEFINIANQVLGKPIYVLEGGGWGDYHPAEHAWHHGQRELIMRLPETSELAEIIADYLQRGMMPMATVNRILRDYNCGFSYQDVGKADDIKVSILITSEDAIPEPDLSKEPLAGHGSLSPPNLDAATAVMLCEFTKFAVRTERSLAEQKVTLTKTSMSASVTAHVSSSTAQPAVGANQNQTVAPPVNTSKKKGKFTE